MPLLISPNQNQSCWIPNFIDFPWYHDDCVCRTRLQIMQHVYDTLVVFEELAEGSNGIFIYNNLLHWLQVKYTNSCDNYKYWFEKAWTEEFIWHDGCGSIYYRPSLLFLNNEWRFKHQINSKIKERQSTIYREDYPSITANTELEF